MLHGPVDIAPQPDLPGPVRLLEGTTGAYPVFRAEDPHSFTPFPLALTYRLAREPVIKEGPLWVTPSLVPESDRRALELDIQWVDLGPRDKRLSLDVIELIQLRYPVSWGNVVRAEPSGHPVHLGGGLRRPGRRCAGWSGGSCCRPSSSAKPDS